MSVQSLSTSKREKERDKNASQIGRPSRCALLLKVSSLCSSSSSSSFRANTTKKSYLLSSFSLRPSALKVVVKAGVGLHVAKSRRCARKCVDEKSQSQHRCLSLSLYIYGSLVLSLLSLPIVVFVFVFLSLLVFNTFVVKKSCVLRVQKRESSVSRVTSFFPFGIQNPIQFSIVFVLSLSIEKSLFFRSKDCGRIQYKRSSSRRERERERES